MLELNESDQLALVLGIRETDIRTVGRLKVYNNLRTLVSNNDVIFMRQLIPSEEVISYLNNLDAPMTNWSKNVLEVYKVIGNNHPSKTVRERCRLMTEWDK